MIGYNTLMVLLGSSLLGACAGLVGGFAVLRRRALVGDALAHAALPGLCLAYLIVGEKDLPSLLVGAFVVGLFGVSLIPALRRWTRIKEDAATGIVLSVFYGAGLVLLLAIQKGGTGDQASLDSYILGQTAGMRLKDVQLIGLCSLVCLAVVLLLYKEFKLIAFDADFARVQGWPSVRLDLLLTGLVALTVVIGLPAVGVVLMAALLIIPAVSARFWTERLSAMLALAALFGFVTGVAGTFISADQPRMPAGPIIILVGAAIFLLSLLFAPRRGVVGRLLAHLRFRRELDERNLLRLLFDLTEPELPRLPAMDCATLLRRKAWKPARLDRAAAAAVADGHAERDPEGQLRLTASGLARAAAVARGQRLWELFLTEHADQASAAANLAQESPEGLVPDDLLDDLTERLERAGRMPRVPAEVTG